MKNAALLIMTIILVSCAHSGKGDQEAFEAAGVTFRAMSVEHLPNLSTPRGGHHTVILGDEITVFGGHTDGFKPVQTAEYLDGGVWHEVQMMYTHDFCAAVRLPDSRIMLMGGTPENFGVGQSWGVETYNPVTHVFSSDCILDRKRARSSAFTMPDGGVLVGGNWYAPDGFGVYRAGDGFTDLDYQCEERTEPFILPASEDKTVVLSADTFQIAPYTYLLVARSREHSDMFAVIKLSGGRFSLLDMDAPLPREGLEGRILWSGNLQVDAQDHAAWIPGVDAGGNVYLARIRYDSEKAAVSFYCAAIHGETHFAGDPIMMPGGRFAMVGGVELSNVDGNPHITNFSTTREAFILHTEAPAKAAVPWTGIVVAAILALLAIALTAIILLRRRRSKQEDVEEPSEAPGSRGDLMSKITALMEEKELFRRSDLKLADLALELGTNVTYISACINGQAGVSFNDFVTGYRVRYAQELMKMHPDKKVSQIAEEAGFSGERSFFRNFKKVTGVTPRQWVESVS